MSTELALTPKDTTEAMEMANMMAKADLLPPHLKNKPADCFRVVAQAARWGMDPFSVADKTSVISGKMMYEGQLVSAVINSRGNLKGRLRYDFDGDPEKPGTLVLTVSGTIQGEDEARKIRLTYDSAKKINRNGQIDRQPEQQMCYIGARIWARRHMPELIMGVYGPDESIEEPADESNAVKTGDTMRNVTDTEEPAEEPAKNAAKKRPSAPKKGAAAAKAKAPAEPEPEPEETESVPDPDDTEPDPEPETPQAQAGPIKEVPPDEVIPNLRCFVRSVKTAKISGKEGLSLELFGDFEGKCYSFLADKKEDCEKSVSEGIPLQCTLKGLRGKKDPTKQFVFAEEIAATEK